MCKESLVFLLSLSAFPVKRESEDFSRVTWQALGKCLILSLLHCVAFSGAGGKLSSGVEVTRVRSIFPVQPHDLIFLAPYSFVWVHPNWYLDLSYMLEDVPHLCIQAQSPACCPMRLPCPGEVLFWEGVFSWVGLASRHRFLGELCALFSLSTGCLLVGTSCPASEDSHFSESVPIPSVFMFYCICNTDLSVALNPLPEPSGQVTG